MGKIHTTLTVDEELIEQAKARGINISGTVNDLLEKALRPKKKDLPEDSLIVYCEICNEKITKGYICEQRKKPKIWCELCHNGPNGKGGITMLECFHKKREHAHQKWGDWGDGS